VARDGRWNHSLTDASTTSIQTEARWLVAGGLAAALLGGAACVLVVSGDLPSGLLGFLLFPVGADTIALVTLLRGHRVLASFPATAGTGYCVTAVVSWLWAVQVFTCSPATTALVLRLSRGRYRPTSCSWGPDGILVFALPAALVGSVVVLIFSFHRHKDWLSWGTALSVCCAFAFQAFLTSRFSPVRSWEFPGWVTLVLLSCCVLAIAFVAAWRAGPTQ